jgi:hypothetical protein
MGNQLLASADKISADDFNAYLAKYADCIEAISASKGCRLMGPGQGQARTTS